MSALTLNRKSSLMLTSAIASLAFVACGVTSAQGPAAEAPLRSPPPISTADPEKTISPDGILSLAHQALMSADSVEIVEVTVREREVGGHSDEIRLKLADEETAFLHVRHGEQVTEVILDPDHKYVRGYFIGQNDVRWQESVGRGIQHLDILRSALGDLESPRLIGTRERNGNQVYVLEGTSPIPVTRGGIGIWAEIEPGTYTLEVDVESMEPVSLVYTYVSTLFHNGTPGASTRVLVQTDFYSINEPVAVMPPSPDEILQPGDATSTPDPRFPATPTPSAF